MGGATQPAPRAALTQIIVPRAEATPLRETLTPMEPSHRVCRILQHADAPAPSPSAPQYTAQSPPVDAPPGSPWGLNTSPRSGATTSVLCSPRGTVTQVPLTHLTIHVIYATRRRHPWLVKDIRTQLFGYIHGICRNINAPLVIAGGVEDHTHLLLDLHPSVALAAAVRDIKANSSRWVHQTFPHLSDFAWQTSYAAFAVSASLRDTVRGYIENQEQHHRSVSFADELREFCQRHGLPFDEGQAFE